MEVIAVGTAAIDVVHEVAAYPAEDTKARSLAAYKCRGGNAASALVRVPSIIDEKTHVDMHRSFAHNWVVVVGG